MNAFNLLSGPVADALGWTLLHAVWQGFALVLPIAVVLYWLRNRSGVVRYRVGVFTLLAQLLVSAGTFFMVLPACCKSSIDACYAHGSLRSSGQVENGRPNAALASANPAVSGKSPEPVCSYLPNWRGPVWFAAGGWLDLSATAQPYGHQTRFRRLVDTNEPVAFRVGYSGHNPGA